MKNRIEEIINSFNLTPHPEGGFYKRSIESSNKVSIGEHKERPIVTGIHYLLSGKDFSCFHKIDADEVWNYYEGNTTLIIHVIHPCGSYEKISLGREQNKYQFCVPANAWFSAEIEDKKPEHYVLSGCIVSPGFLFETFEMATYSDLSNKYPSHEPIIKLMTRG